MTGSILKEYRVTHRLTQKELGLMTKISRHSIMSYENGKKIPTDRVIVFKLFFEELEKKQKKKVLLTDKEQKIADGVLSGLRAEMKSIESLDREITLLKKKLNIMYKLQEQTLKNFTLMYELISKNEVLDKELTQLP